MSKDIFDGLIGQDNVKKKLSFYLKAFNKTSICPFLNFVGAKGLGKTEFAKAFVKSFGKAWASSNRTVTSLFAITGKKICSKNASLFLIVEQLISINGLFEPSSLVRLRAKDLANSVLPKPLAPTKFKKGQILGLLNAFK